MVVDGLPIKVYGNRTKPVKGTVQTVPEIRLSGLWWPGSTYCCHFPNKANYSRLSLTDGEVSLIKIIPSKSIPSLIGNDFGGPCQLAYIFVIEIVVL